MNGVHQGAIVFFTASAVGVIAFRSVAGATLAMPFASFAKAWRAG